MNLIKTKSLNIFSWGLVAATMMIKRGWGGRIRRRGMVELYPYGSALEPYFEKLEQAATTDSSFAGARKKGAIKGLAEARKAPSPDLISIEEHIKTNPERAFLEWMAEQQKNKGN